MMMMMMTMTTTTTIIPSTDTGNDQEFKRWYVQPGHWPDEPDAREEKEVSLGGAAARVLCWQTDIRDRRSTKLIVHFPSVCM